LTGREQCGNPLHGQSEETMDRDRVKNFADKVFSDMAGAMTAGMGYVGVKTGLFRAMAGKGAMTVDDVARESGLMPRYVEEWVKGMTCAGYLDYDAAGETYRLPDEHAFLLASDDTDHFWAACSAWCRYCCAPHPMSRPRSRAAAASSSERSAPKRSSAST
jgi:hypothetical protein